MAVRKTRRPVARYELRELRPGKSQTLEGQAEGTHPTANSRWGHHSQVSSDRVAADESIDRQGAPELIAPRAQSRSKA